jgi:hypothetical protein
LDIAGKVFQGVQRGLKLEVDWDLKAPGLAGDKAVATDAVFTYLS